MFRSTRTVTLLGIAVQVAAFIRTAIIAAALGTALDVDAYNLGLVAPTLVATVVGGWLQVAFVGRYAGLVATGDDARAAAYRMRMLALVGACSVVLAAAFALFPAQIMALLVPPSQPEILAISTEALRVLGWLVVPVILADFLGIVLNSHGLFFAAALAPLINALVAVAGLWLWPTVDLGAMAWTLLLGAAAQLLVVFVALARLRLRYPLDTSAAKGELRTTLLLGLSILPAMLLSNSSAAIIQFRATEFGEGAVATFGYASRLHSAVAQILVIGLGTVLLPHLAALWSRGEKAEIATLFRRLARAGLFATAYLAIGIWLMGEATVGALLGRGAFDAQEARDVALLWGVLGLSLFPYAFGTFIAKLAQAMRSGPVILISSAIGFAAVILTTWAGSTFGSLPLVVAALVASPCFVTSFWTWWLGRQVAAGPILADLLQAIPRVAIVLAPAAALTWFLAPLTAGLPQLVDVLIRGSAFTLTAGGILLATRWHRWFLERPASVLGA